MVKLIRQFLTDQSGATAIEYGLIAGLVCVAAMGAMFALGDAMIYMYDLVQNTLVAVAAKAG